MITRVMLDLQRNCNYEWTLIINGHYFIQCDYINKKLL